VRTAPDVAGFAADIMLDEERFDGTDENDGARCATARHGKPASKTTDGKNRPQKRNMVPPPNELKACYARRALFRNTGQFVGGWGDRL
jgi:hypothetical protein